MYFFVDVLETKKMCLESLCRWSNVQPVNSDQEPFRRLRLKRELFWYRHHPKMQEIVSDRSSRPENRTDLRKVSMRALLLVRKMQQTNAIHV